MQAEEGALKAATTSTVLSQLDADCLSLVDPSLTPPVVLLPPLRSDIAALAAAGSSQEGWREGWQKRKYITCCIRVTEAKNVKVFCQAIGLIADQLKRDGYTPFLCGSGLAPKVQGGEVSAYARECKVRSPRYAP